MLQNLTYASEKLQANGKSASLVTQELYIMAGGSGTQGSKQPFSTGVRVLKDFKAEAMVKTTKAM